MKVCTKCKEDKPFSSFGNAARYAGGLRSECKECCKKRNKELLRRNPEKARAKYKRSNSKRSPEAKRRSALKSLYGITPEQIDDMVLAQGGCAICKRTTFTGKNWAVDHDHDYEAKTGGIKIRGILCMKCNAMLGMADEKKEVFIAAVQYLDKHKA